jgi:alpha-galactosidase
MRYKRISSLGLCHVTLLAALTGMAVTPGPADYQLRQQWAASWLTAQPGGTPSHLELVYEDAHDKISRGRSWCGTPFQISAKTYQHGLAFNANKHLRICLDRPAERFTSDIGLENNDSTRLGARSGSGSVTFHLLAGGKELFASPVLRLKDDPRQVDVPLQGAKEFEIRVGDAGDGRGWDQGLWGGAEVHLQDGTRLRLQDLPWTNAIDSSPARVSFQYGEKPSAEFLKSWTRGIRSSPLPGGGQTQEILFRDPATSLEVQVTAKTFADFPAVEWVGRFKNAGSSDTPLLKNIQALDGVFALPAAEAAILHWAAGGVATFDDFAPRTTELKAGSDFALQPGEGRSSSEILPFFNLEGDGAGVVLAVGWSGRWAAKFESAQPGVVRVRAGMAQTSLVLHPGEEIRTPSMLALFYQGDRWRGQNLLRQFLLAHHRPQRNGQPLVPPITCGNWGGTRAEVHLENIRRFIEERLPIEYYWIDAEWYGNMQGDTGWASNVGRWNVKTNLYPQGFKPLSEALRKDGRELMLWFEPERVVAGTPWHKDHRDWLFDTGSGTLLFNLGHSEACRFVTGFISDRITEFGLGCYRQDFNMDPLPYWQKADPPRRQGISEIRHIEGLYAFWDGLLARHPNLIIDNCASGGRRIDLETVGRATPFWRTDGPRDAIAHQCHTYGLLTWVPLSATSQDREGDDYEFRSSMSSSLCINWAHSGDGPCEKLPADFPFGWARGALNQYVSIRDFYLGDYYPLTSYSQAADAWMAYQLDRPDHQDGLVVVLRRPKSPYESARFPLRGVEANGTYLVTDLDTGARQKQSGQALLEAGVGAVISTRPGSALLTYKRQKE